MRTAALAWAVFWCGCGVAPGGAVAYVFETTEGWPAAEMVFAAPPASATAGWASDETPAFTLIGVADCSVGSAYAESSTGATLDGGVVFASFPGVAIESDISAEPGGDTLSFLAVGFPALRGDWVLAGDPAPEPPGWLLLGIGAVLTLARRRRHQRGRRRVGPGDRRLVGRAYLYLRDRPGYQRGLRLDDAAIS